MTTTLLAKDTAHKTAYPVFTPGGGFDMVEMQGAAVTHWQSCAAAFLLTRPDRAPPYL
jgi:hypothetical protein